MEPPSPQALLKGHEKITKNKKQKKKTEKERGRGYTLWNLKKCEEKDSL